MKIGFYGLGQMGSAMAHRLVQGGHEVVVFNRTMEKARPLANAGAKLATSPADLSSAEVIITMLADDAAVENAALEGDRLSHMFGQATTHLSMSTISMALCRRLTDAHARAGGALVAAPVFGRPDAAAAGKLFILAAGSARGKRPQA
jgi:3-hydroxyisobutyrate dehydrogenase-like beta-hydroxyacid dehydrogenase